MGKGLGVALGLVAAVFMVLGAGWLIAPAVVAPQLGMTLQEAVGLSTQIGDLGSFFLTVGVCTLIAQVIGKRLWFHPAIMLLGLAALGRVVAWLFHDAAREFRLAETGSTKSIVRKIVAAAEARKPGLRCVAPRHFALFVREMRILGARTMPPRKMLFIDGKGPS